jgi:hypothetical protein
LPTSRSASAPRCRRHNSEGETTTGHSSRFCCCSGAVGQVAGDECQRRQVLVGGLRVPVRPYARSHERRWCGRRSGTSSSLTIPRSSRLSYAATAWTGQRLHVRLPITGQAACDTGTAVELADVRRPVDGKPGTEIVCRGQLRLDGSSACRRWTAHGSAAMPERDRLPPLPVRRSRSAITAALRVSREPRASHRGPPWRRSGVAGVGPWRAVCLVSVRPGERPTGRMLSHVPSR